MNQVVITGLGVVCSLGCEADVVAHALRSGKSGIVAAPELLEYGLSCGVYAPVKDWDAKRTPRKARQTMGDFANYAAAATLDALQDAQLDPAELPDVEKTGIIIGSAFGGINEISKMNQFLSRNKKSRAGAVGVVKMMNSSASGNIATMLGVRGGSYSLSSSFTAGLDNVGHGYEQIKFGTLDVVICGAAEEECWKQIGPSMDRWDAFTTRFNDDPESASRPYDADRDGIVMSAGSGILILESLEHALQRGAQIYSEIIGYGATNDGSDMFRPNGEGLSRAITAALNDAEIPQEAPLDYVNTHGTATRVGDAVETDVLRRALPNTPPVSSVKGQTGHALSACGALEAVYTNLMMRHQFIAPTKNLENVAPDCAGINHVQSMVETEVKTAMCINMGLGGTNSAMIFRNFSNN